MHDFRISAAVYTIAILLSVAPVDAVEKLTPPSANSRLPSPPDISLFELQSRTRKGARLRLKMFAAIYFLPEAALGCDRGPYSQPRRRARAGDNRCAESFRRCRSRPMSEAERVQTTLPERAQRSSRPRSSGNRATRPATRVADAVAHIESSYNPEACWRTWRSGLDADTSETVSLLGRKGTADGLFGQR